MIVAFAQICVILSSCCEDSFYILLANYKPFISAPALFYTNRSSVKEGASSKTFLLSYSCFAKQLFTFRNGYIIFSIFDGLFEEIKNVKYK